MISFYTRREVTNRLNIYLNNYNDIRILCDLVDNDVDEFYSVFFRIVAFALTNSHDFLKNTNNLIDSFYLMKYNNQRRNTIREKELLGVNIPNKEFIIGICRNNKLVREEMERKDSELRNHYNSLRGFNEVGMTYTRPEMVHVNKTFNYYYPDSTGNVYEDYEALYNDGRYDEDNNPLNNGYQHNINSMRRNNNINLLKCGNLYEIDNGRHRLLYVLYHGRDEVIPCIVTRRIENKEFNIITSYLRRYYNAYIYKNNIFNDYPNIVIALYDKLYNVNGIDELKDFYNNVKNIEYLEKYYVSNYYADMGYSSELLRDYLKVLIDYYKKYGYSFIDSNFSDILKIFPENNNNIFYDAFYQFKYYYLRNAMYDEKDKMFDIFLDEYDDGYKKR